MIPTDSFKSGTGDTLVEDSFMAGVEDKIEDADESGLEIDPNIVDFDGPDDPALALNWSKSRKWTIIGLVGYFTFIACVCPASHLFCHVGRLSC